MVPSPHSKTALDKLLRPQSIAVVGASEKSGLARSLCENLLKKNNTDHVFFVSSSRESVLGKPCYKLLSDLPMPVDMVVICIPKTAVHNILHQMAALGITAGVVLASGYSETGKEEDKLAEQELMALAKELGIAIMGPNCAGFINFISGTSCFGLDITAKTKAGSVAVLSQSGQICMTILDMGRLAFSFVISAGNSSIVTLESYLTYLINDKHTQVIAIYLEGITNPKAFVDALKLARKKKKPVVILKAGASQKGSQIASSHTGSLAGSDAAYGALFKKYSVIRVVDMEELIATSLLLSTLKELPATAGFASMNLSGGETGICADLGEQCGLNFPDFTAETYTKLQNLLPSYATPSNPLDTTATLSYDPPGYAKLLRTVMEDENIGMVLCGFTILPATEDPCISCMVEGIEIAMASGPIKPMVIVSFAECSREEAIIERLRAVNVPVLSSTLYSLRVMKYLVDYMDSLSRNITWESAIPTMQRCGQKTTALSEKTAATLLEKAGIPMSPSLLATRSEDLAPYAAALGFPLVAKICSPHIMHKSDIGGVIVNIKTQEDLNKAYTSILNNACQHYPKATIEGVLLQKMATIGTEMVIGVTVDSQFGPMVMCGMGGVFVEILKDVSLYPAPLNNDEAVHMLKQLKGYPLLKGHRGAQPKDRDALVKAIVAVSNFAVDNKDTLAELDINPVFVYEEGLCAVDALILHYQ